MPVRAADSSATTATPANPYSNAAGAAASIAPTSPAMANGREPIAQASAAGAAWSVIAVAFGPGAMLTAGAGIGGLVPALFDSSGGLTGSRVIPHDASRPVSVTRNMAWVADTRNCEQCGTLFSLRREHARFCSARCRVAWNRENAGDRSAGASALDWSIAAMREATGRLVRAGAWNRARAFAVVSESVWWVTIVDGTLVRYHPAAYDAVLAGQAAAERQLIEGTLAGLRFVRNQARHDGDYADFIQPGPGRSSPGGSRVTAWTWKSAPEPLLASRPPRGQAWEMTRYRAYQAQLAGHTVGEVFGRAAAFLQLAAANAASVPDGSTHAAR